MGNNSFSSSTYLQHSLSPLASPQTVLLHRHFSLRVVIPGTSPSMPTLRHLTTNGWTPTRTTARTEWPISLSPCSMVPSSPQMRITCGARTTLMTMRSRMSRSAPPMRRRRLHGASTWSFPSVVAIARRKMRRRRSPPRSPIRNH